MSMVTAQDRKLECGKGNLIVYSEAFFLETGSVSILLDGKTQNGILLFYQAPSLTVFMLGTQLPTCKLSGNTVKHCIIQDN